MIPRDHPLADRILGLVPINGLDPRLQDQALAQGELLEFRRKKTVFEAGARDPYTFYLVDGELNLQAEGASPVRMQAGDENARRALAQLQPRRYTAVTISNVTVFRIERAVLDHILADEQTLEEPGTETDMDVREIEDDEEDDGDWMTRLLSSALFMRLPHDNIQRFFAELEPMEAADGQVVVEQGTSGDYLYIIAEGQCAVTRRAPGGGREVQLAVLTEGDSFGEEALISDSPRNASVRMVGEGMLMRLAKNAFEELVTKPTLKALTWSEATKEVEDGARWLDVRFADEHASTAIENSLNVPLNVLRLQVNKLDADTRYVVYCDTGARSSAGAFLLLRLGFDACYLAGGLERSPLPQDPPSTPAKEPAEEPEEAPRSAAAAAAAFEFELVAGDQADEADGDSEAVQPEAAQPEAAQPEAQAAPPPAAAQEKTPPVAPAPAGSAAATPAPTAPEPAAATAAAPQKTASQAAAEMERARVILAQLKAERDKATAYGQRAVEAARELKRRNDELAAAISTERTRREQLETELGALRADAERAESLEQARLQGELEKSAKRLEVLQNERAEEQRKAAEELERLRAAGAQNEERLQSLTAEKEQTEAARAAAQVSFQDTLREAGEKAERLAKDLEKVEQELGQTREQLAEAETRSREVDASLQAQTSEIETQVAEAQTRLEEEKQRLGEERARHAEDVERLQHEHDEKQTALRAERAELDREIAAQQARIAELDRREADLGNARAAVDAELGEREQALVRREESLAEGEEALSSEKAAWKETVEKAIIEERERLEGDYARFRDETRSELQKRAETIADERIDMRLEEQTEKLRADHEAREATMRAQVEAHVAKLLAEFDGRLAKVRSGYETRLNEQEALLEDERRRLETEIVRLRAALEDTRGTAGAAEAPPAPMREPMPAPAAPAAPAPALDFEINEAAAAAADLTLDSGAARAPSPAIALDLEIDAAEVTPPPPPEPEPDSSVVPLIELPEDEDGDDVADGRKESASEKEQRVISQDQLADIRKRMQEKMRAAKSKSR